jgi:cytochrome c-type biogenesis protein CcmH/NrfG
MSESTAVEILKRPISAVLGIGVNNFAAMFTTQKDVQYNVTNQWQIPSFNYAKSTLLHVMTETGLLGVAALVLLLVIAFQQYMMNPQYKSSKLSVVPLLFLVVLVLLFPPSITLFYLLFVVIALTFPQGEKTRASKFSFDLSKLMPVSIVLLVLTLGIVGVSSYFLGRAYLANYHFGEALKADALGDLQKDFDQHREAIILNPYMEQYRISFSRVNMFIANSVFLKAQNDVKDQKDEKGNPKQVTLTDDQKNMIIERIQVSVAEAKAAVTLNPQKSTNWENLAGIYTNILTAVKDSEAWTITAYQRAIVLDPNNPSYRLYLGGVYYTIGAYQDAQQLYGDAIQRKPDWPLAYYRYALAAFQNKNSQLAQAALEKTLSLLDPEKDKTDYKQVQKDLSDLKKQILEETEATKSASLNQQGKVSAPEQPVASVEPKLQIKEASPEAK